MQPTLDDLIRSVWHLRASVYLLAALMCAGFAGTGNLLAAIPAFVCGVVWLVMVTDPRGKPPVKTPLVNATLVERGRGKASSDLPS